MLGPGDGRHPVPRSRRWGANPPLPQDKTFSRARSGDRDVFGLDGLYVFGSWDMVHKAENFDLLFLG